jgi:hypothetical protein
MKLKATISPGWAVTELGVNWNLLFAATVTIIVAAEAVMAWARPTARIVEKSILWDYWLLVVGCLFVE